MDIQFEKLRIMHHLASVDEEWIIMSFKALLGISDKGDSDFVKKYEANLKPMTKEELIRRSEEALEDYYAGRYVDLEDYIKSLESETITDAG